MYTSTAVRPQSHTEQTRQNYVCLYCSCVPFGCFGARVSSSSSSDAFDGWGDDTEEEGEGEDSEGNDDAVYDWTTVDDTTGKEERRTAFVLFFA